MQNEVLVRYQSRYGTGVTVQYITCTVPYRTVPYIFTITRGYRMVRYSTVRYVDYKKYVRTAPSGCVIVQYRLQDKLGQRPTKKVNATLAKSNERTHIY